MSQVKPSYGTYLMTVSTPRSGIIRRLGAVSSTTCSVLSGEGTNKGVGIGYSGKNSNSSSAGGINTGLIEEIIGVASMTGSTA